MKTKNVFSIIVVALNAGEELHKTVDSILRQTYKQYEIVVKDGLSTDGSVEALPQDERIRRIYKKDCGIYDAMNQALGEALGEYIIFLNCGDYFYDDRVLERLAESMEKEKTVDDAMTDTNVIYYGNIYERMTKSYVQSNPNIDAFACYRNIPCHQACVYSRDLFEQRGFDVSYRVRADYEHFLWCFFERHAQMKYVDITVASYEGGGFSEVNEKLSRLEHRQICATYMTTAQRIRYKLIMILTLAPLRSAIAKNPALSGIYNACKQKLYDRKR